MGNQCNDEENESCMKMEIGVTVCEEMERKCDVTRCNMKARDIDDCLLEISRVTEECNR